MPISSTSPEIAATITKLRELLEKEYGADFSYSVCGKGLIIAQSNKNGVEFPIPGVKYQRLIEDYLPADIIKHEEKERGEEDLEICEQCDEKAWDGRICYLCGAKNKG